MAKVFKGSNCIKFKNLKKGDVFDLTHEPGRYEALCDAYKSHDGIDYLDMCLCGICCICMGNERLKMEKLSDDLFRLHSDIDEIKCKHMPGPVDWGKLDRNDIILYQHTKFAITRAATKQEGVYTILVTNPNYCKFCEISIQLGPQWLCEKCLFEVKVGLPVFILLAGLIIYFN